MYRWIRHTCGVSVLAPQECLEELGLKLWPRWASDWAPVLVRNPRSFQHLFVFNVTRRGKTIRNSFLSRFSGAKTLRPWLFKRVTTLFSKTLSTYHTMRQERSDFEQLRCRWSGSAEDALAKTHLASNSCGGICCNASAAARPLPQRRIASPYQCRCQGAQHRQHLCKYIYISIYLYIYILLYVSLFITI